MSEATEKTPEWMLLLEKKKNKPHRLAHEIGAGAPCFSCGDACPGLDLHFWRKLCRNCKCKKEDHDVKDDEGYEQFEILFASSGKKRCPGALLNMKVPEAVGARTVDQKKSIPFDWVPPNISEDLAAEYMQQLPECKLPISGSDGALYRRQQLEKQVPLHDLDATKCHGLTANEIEGLEHYLENLRNNVVGQGQVVKVPALYTEQRLRHMGPKIETSLTVGQYALKGESWSTRISNSQSANNVKHPPAAPIVPPPPPPSTPSSDGCFFLSESQPLCYGREGALVVDQSVHNVAFSGQVPGLISQQSAPIVAAKQSNSNVAAKALDGTYIPFSNNITGHVVHSSPIPGNSMPKSAIILQKNGAVGKIEEELAEKLEQLKDLGENPDKLEQHLDCNRCKEGIHSGQVAVFAERAGENTAWHPQCFVCSTCKELLVDLIYFYYKGNVYCGRHYAELLDIPRCFACDELIFVKEYTCAEGKAFHVKHFCCYECDIPLGGKQYISKENQPFCLDCYQNKFGKSCNTCHHKIAPGDQRVGWKELSWHVSPNCFCCFHCSKSLLGGKFVVKTEQPFCSKECVQAALR